MELQTIAAEIIRVSKRLEASADALFELGKVKASSERDYRLALSQELLKLKSEGMPATLIGDIARGKLADYLFARDVAEARFRAGIEASSSLKSTLSALQSILRFQQDL